MRKKYQIGGVMGLSSSPLTSLIPQTSPFQKPNFENAFQFDPWALWQGMSPFQKPNFEKALQQETSPTNEWAQKFRNITDKMKFQIGLATQNSSNPVTAVKGQMMVDDTVNGTNTFDVVNGSNTSQITPTDQRKTPFSEKFSNSTFGKNFEAWDAGLDIANTAFTGLFGEKSAYSGEKGGVTRTMDSMYDSVKDLARKSGPFGQALSLGMEGHELLGKAVNKLAGTDGETTIDALLDSDFLFPLGAVNGVAGENADTITKDTQAFEVVGSSYTGSNQKVNNALKKSGKRFGILSHGDLNEANKLIAEATGEQIRISDIAKDSINKFNIRNSMAAINKNKYASQLQGDYDQSAVRVGRRGLKVESITKAKEILSKYKQQQTNQLQQGGPLDPFEHYLSTLPENQRDSTNFRVKDYWIFNDKPKDFKEARRRGMFTQDKAGLFHARSIAENPETEEIEYMKASSHPTRYMESDWYEKGLIYNEDQNGNIYTIQLKPGVPGYEDWKQFTNDYELVKSEPYWKYVKRQQKEIPSHKDGGTFIELATNETSIELIDPMSIPEFQNGGSINVIPDGALHARKHNMEMEGITRKGIPVVSESNGEIEQQAEIEKEEIIFRLEVTQKLEELEKKFYSDESTQEEKDECALEAGKLLVNEILYNTQDNTNNLL